MSIYKTYFRQYDIRGIVDDHFNGDFAYTLGNAFGKFLDKQALDKKVVVGYDGRVSTPDMKKGLINGLLSSGVQVIEINLVPTPLTYFARVQLKISNSIMITGSHNAKNYNGFKIICNGGSSTAGQIQEIRKIFESLVGQAQILQENNPVELNKWNDQNEAKYIVYTNVINDYLIYVCNQAKVLGKRKVVVDSGNGVAGVVAPELLNRLGFEVIELFSEVDGNFPNHHPDPSRLENLETLVKAVKEHKADCGIAFDGDADRIGVVDENGKIMEADRILMVLARDILSSNKGKAVVYDVKCSSMLKDIIERSGGSPVMSATGHSLIKNKIAEIDAVLAGELSGHIFFNDSRWFGFDDAIYSAVRFLEILSSTPLVKCSELLADIPEKVTTSEINIKVDEHSKFEIMQKISEDSIWGNADVIRIDGMRVEWSDSWGLIRASNTSPALVLRFEADNKQSLERTINIFVDKLKNVVDDISPLTKYL